MSDNPMTQDELGAIRIRLNTITPWPWTKRENLRKQIDWLAKVLARYADACPLEISMLNDGDIAIPKIKNCDGSWPADDYFDCSEYNPEKCWKEAARRAVEEEDDAE